MFDLLTSNGDLATELIARTSNTGNVQKIVQISLAPVFLFAAIAAFLNVINVRLIWLADRIDWLVGCGEEEWPDPSFEELPILRRRQVFAYRAVNFSMIAAMLVCCVVALMFVSAFVHPPIGSFVAGAWILAMMLVFLALLSFLMETRLATSSAGERRRPSRKISNRVDDAGHRLTRPRKKKVSG